MTDPTSVVLEVSVDSVASALAAERGGAHRVELCSDLLEGGVTPSGGMIAMARKRVAIPIHVLIRPRAGDFCYTADEFEVMKRDILLAKQLGANGVVLGILESDGNIDVPRTRELADLAQPLSVTFHRAFDAIRDSAAALEAVVAAGANRILTSGGASTASEGAGTIARMVSMAAGRVTIMACGRIRENNVRWILENTGVCEVHANLGSPVGSPMGVPSDGNAVGSPDGSIRAEVLPATVAAFLKAASGGVGSNETSDHPL